MTMMILLFVAALWAGAQNALAGGGSFITLPVLILSGLDPRAANIASTVALFPGQVLTGLSGRKLVSGTKSLSFYALFALSIVGGAVGGILLLATPESFFASLVPWLVLFATTMFGWGSFGPKRAETNKDLGLWGTAFAQFIIAIYGGYFGGGIGFLMLAALTMAGLPVRNAGATKNMLAGVMNASAVAIFIYSSPMQWPRVLVLSVGAILGGQLGVWMLKRVNEKILRIGIVCIGILLTIGLFIRTQ
jgi:uncharacterized protein